MKLENLDLKFETIYKQLSSEKFLQLQGLSGEIPFFISTYNPEQENDVTAKVKTLINRLQINGITALELNLYDIATDLLEERNLIEKVKSTEKSMGKVKLFSSLQNVLDAERYLIPAIEKKMHLCDDADGNNAKMVLLTGVGTVFPYIRSHTVLNNLQNAVKDRPMLMFFPRLYDGHQLNLFGKMKDDNHYRAFNIEHYSTS
ncbi:MAG: DUF1788 domain-containing protein [Campylobacterota bacterium]|nr:DUF1788 domain-containing protein [Campylobacterota bacterium]